MRRNALATIGCSLTTLTLAALLTGGCGRTGNSATSNTFAYNEIEDLNTLDPARTSARAPWWVGGQIFVGLVGLDSSLAPIPLIAKSWSTSDDGKRWTFNLRNDVFFADDPCFPDGKGRRVTAEDIRYSFERICNPGTASTGFWVFRGKVRGAEEFYASPAAGTHVSGFGVPNDTTFEMELIEPSPLVLSLLSMPYCFIVPREAVEKYGNDFFRHPVGAGPFRLAEWKTGERLVLTRNPRYFERDAAGKQLPYLDSVKVSFITDKKTEFVEFQQGHLDAVTSIDPAFLDQVFTPDGNGLVGEYAKFRLYTVPSMSIEYYGIMLDKNAPGANGSVLVDNRFLRRAINYAIDRESIVRYVLHGQAIPATHGPIPPGIPGYSGVEGYRFDREMARKLLDSAGYPGGKGAPELSLQISESERVIAVAQAIQEQLNAVGIRLKINRVSPAQHRSMAADGKLPFWRANWMADYPDAENFLALFYSKYASPSGSNTTRFANATVDSLYRAALAPGLTTEQRSLIYGAAERIVLDQAPWIFIYHSSIQRLTQPGIEGYSVDPLDRLVLTNVRKQHS